VKYQDTDWVIIPLNTSGEEALTTASGRMFQSRTVRGKKNKGNSHNHTPEYFRGRGPDDRFRKNVPVTNSAGEKE